MPFDLALAQISPGEAVSSGAIFAHWCNYYGNHLFQQTLNNN
jgi:hypothetical protein